MMIEAMKQALEALENSQRFVEASANAEMLHGWGEQLDTAEDAITSLRQAIAKLESQEPDKYEMDIECTKCGAKQSGVLTVNTHPPQRTEQEPVKWADYEPDGMQHNKPSQCTWVGLTDEEIYTESRSHEKWAKDGSEWFSRGSFARAIEAKLKEKNT